MFKLDYYLDFDCFSLVVVKFAFTIDIMACFMVLNESNLAGTTEVVMHFKFGLKLMVFYLELIILVIPMDRISEQHFIGIMAVHMLAFKVSKH